MACGSNVTNENSGGSGGSGGAGGSGGSGGSTDPQVACADFCHAMETNNCPAMFGNCTEFCDMAFANTAPECYDAMGAMFNCYLPSVPTCPDEPPVECKPQEDAAQACQAQNGCTGGECFGSAGMNGETACGCTDSCKGVEYSTDCQTPAGGPTTCTCTQGGMVVGTCTNPNADACGVQESCCNAEFFKL